VNTAVSSLHPLTSCALLTRRLDDRSDFKSNFTRAILFLKRRLFFPHRARLFFGRFFSPKINKFLVGVTEALCQGGFLANSGLAPGLHGAASSASRPASASSIASATNPQLGTGVSLPGTSSAAGGATTKGGRGGGGGGSGGGSGGGENGGAGGFSEADLAALRGAATSLARIKWNFWAGLMSPNLDASFCP